MAFSTHRAYRLLLHVAGATPRGYMLKMQRDEQIRAALLVTPMNDDQVPIGGGDEVDPSCI